MRQLLCGLLVTGLFLVPASWAQEDNPAKAILEKAVKAHGGEKNLAKLKARQEKSQSTSEVDGQSFTSTRDFLVQLPDRMKLTRESESYTIINVISGDKGWVSYGSKTSDYTAEQVKRLKEPLHTEYVLTLTPLLKDMRFTLSLLGEIKVNDRPVHGVKVSAKGHQDVELYFDKETGLLVKSQFKEILAGMREFDREAFYSDYKEVEGLKWPMKHVQYRDGRRFGETEITELKFLEKIDVSVFDRP